MGHTKNGMSMMCAVASCLFLSFFPGRSFAVEVCYPPELPFVPASDAELLEFADIIDAEYQQYFKSITDYFTCMDRSRQEAFDEAKSNTGHYAAFLERLETLRNEQAGSSD